MFKGGERFKKLRFILAGCALLLVLAGAALPVLKESVGVPETPAAAFRLLSVGVGYWLFNSLTLVLALVVAVWSGQDRRLFWTASSMMLATLAQLVLGSFILRSESPWPFLIACHLLLGLFTLGLAIFLATAATLPPAYRAAPAPAGQTHRFYFRSVVFTGLGLLLLLGSGVLVAGTGSGSACPDWPLCRGEIFPFDFSPEMVISLLHRFTVVAIAVLGAGVILQTQRRYKLYPQLKRWSNSLGCLFMVQVGLGGLYSLTDQTHLVSMLHMGLAIAIWGNLVILGSLFYLTIELVMPSTAELEPQPVPMPFRQKAVTFFKLTKPWIMVLLLITTIMAMIIAQRGIPPLALMMYTLLGGILSAGGASVLNSYIDSDIDQVMSRTSRRATATGLVTPQETLIFGLSLSALSFLLFAIFVNLLSALLSTLGILYYVFFYTLYLKRTTLHNIIIGGAAGAIPPLVGWTAVTNSLDLGAFYLFAIIFFWTPPHTWALALLVKKDYAQARVPMLPVVVGEKETVYQIFLYSILLITLTLLPFTFQMVSWLYMASALLLGGRFLWLAWKLWRTADKGASRRLYKFSQAYLALLFVMMALDRTLL